MNTKCRFPCQSPSLVYLVGRESQIHHHSPDHGKWQSDGSFQHWQNKFVLGVAVVEVERDVVSGLCGPSCLVSSKDTCRVHFGKVGGGGKSSLLKLETRNRRHRGWYLRQ